MDSAFISAFAALGGALIGGLTSFATSWLTQQAQAREQQRWTRSPTQGAESRTATQGRNGENSEASI